MKKSLTIAAILTLTAFATPAYAETNCSVSPETVKILQGSSGSAKVLLNVDAGTAYELTLGNLPSSTEGGLTEKGSAITLTIETNADAQTGSFQIPLLYRLASSGDGAKLICQLNLVIEKNATAKASKSVSKEKVKTISKGELPTNFDTGAVTTGNTTSSPLGKTLITMKLMRGSRGLQVSALQDILKLLKFFPIEIESTGYFGEVTETAVRAFQIMNNLESVGYVGPRTRSALNSLIPISTSD